MEEAFLKKSPYVYIYICMHQIDNETSTQYRCLFIYIYDNFIKKKQLYDKMAKIK